MLSTAKSLFIQLKSIRILYSIRIAELFGLNNNLFKYNLDIHINKTVDTGSVSKHNAYIKVIS